MQYPRQPDKLILAADLPITKANYSPGSTWLFSMYIHFEVMSLLQLTWLFWPLFQKIYLNINDSWSHENPKKYT